MKTYTYEDKIDYIFNELKTQKRWRKYKLIFKVLIILWIIFMYFNFVQWLNKQELTNNISQMISDLIKPISQNIANDLMNDVMNNNWINNTQDISKWLINELKKNSDLLNNLK